MYVSAGSLRHINVLGKLVNFKEVGSFSLENVDIILLEYIAFLDATDRLNDDLFQNTFNEPNKIT